MEVDTRPVVEHKSIFRDINADDDPEVTEIESYCINCESNGITKIFLTKIPFFKEVIIMSFYCDDCGFSNNELQPGGMIQELGIHYNLRVTKKEDLDRQVVQTNSATIKIPELSLEIPLGNGSITNIEGVIRKTILDLDQQQPLRKIQHPDLAEQLETFIDKLKNLLLMEEPFTLVIDDPSGNSFLENPYAPAKDSEMTVNHYKRSPEQNESLCLAKEEPEDRSRVVSAGIPADNTLDLQNEVLSFHVNCPGCNNPCETNMKQVNIPHFKDVIIMATVCEACGHRDNEVKSGGAIEPKGTCLDLFVRQVSDLSRDVLKSETSRILIPELEFETEVGSLGGKFTTIEGLINNIIDSLTRRNPFCYGDSSAGSGKNKLEEFCDKLKEIISGERLNIHFVLDDPAGNSYIQDMCFPEMDQDLKITHYERDFDQNEALGLNDMKTENYENTETEE